MNETDLATTGGPRLHVRWWSGAPPSRPMALVVIVHGFAEHGGRYDMLAHRLVDAGCTVVAGDHRGHGRSEGKRRSVARFHEYIDDLDRVVDWSRALAEGAPLVLLGHSLGGLIALSYALRHGDSLTGLVLSAPSVLPGRVNVARRIAGRALSAVAPDAGVLRLPLHRISRDPDVVIAYMRDPLVCAGPLRARLGVEMLDAMAAVDAGLPQLQTPLLAMQGTADGLVDATAARHVYERAGSSDKTLREYPGLWHEIFNEPERDTVIADLVQWLDARFARRSPVSGEVSRKPEDLEKA